MRIEKEVKGNDGELRKWVIDYDNNFIGYVGKAGDFKVKKEVEQDGE